jgi:hypothetical protein
VSARTRPSILALQCECSDEVCDIEQAEAGELDKSEELTPPPTFGVIETLHKAKLPEACMKRLAREEINVRGLRAELESSGEEVWIRGASTTAIAAIFAELEHRAQQRFKQDIQPEED